MASPVGSSEGEAEIRDEQRQGEIVVQVFKGELPPPTRRAAKVTGSGHRTWSLVGHSGYKLDIF